MCIAYLKALRVDYIIHFNFFLSLLSYAFSLFLNFNALCLWGIVVALGKIYSASGTGSENKESSNWKNELETIEEILTLNSCQLPTHNGTQITHIPYMKDVIGMVALLGKVDDDNLSRLVSHSIQ